MLQSLGATHIDLVADAKEFIKFCNQKTYDIVLIDYNLGEGENGQQLLEELRTKKVLKNTTVVIMVTAEMSQEMVLSAIEHKPNAYLAKPFTFSFLKNRLDKEVMKNDALYKILGALDEDNYSTAITLCDQLLTKATKYANWCIQTKANLLYKLGRYDEAVIIYNEQLSERQIEWALLGLGKSYAIQEKYSDALAIFNTLVTSNPMHLDAYDWLSKMHTALDQTDAAQLALEKAVSFSPRSYTLLHHLAQHCERNNNFEKAVEIYKQAQNIAKNSIHYGPDNGLELAKCITTFAAHSDEDLAKKLTLEALSALENIITEFKNDQRVEVKVKIVEARVHHILKDEEKTQSILKAADKLIKSMSDISDPAMVMELAKAYVNTDNIAKAQTILKELGEKYADDEKMLAEIKKIVANIE